MTVFRSVCHYCGTAITNPQDVTADHVIPKCALTLFPELRDGRTNKVRCCKRCNGQKASLPLSVFLEVRNHEDKLKAAQRTWQGIIYNLMFGHTNPELRARALEAYQPDPSKIFAPAGQYPIDNPSRPTLAKALVINPPFSKNRPLKRLYYLEDVVRDWNEDRRATGTASGAS